MSHVRDHPSPSSSKRPHQQSDEGTTELYTAQCGECFKWRLIPTKEEYEEIRSTFVERPFICDQKQNSSCDDPEDIEYETVGTWVIDKPGIPITPKGFLRKLIFRKDYSKMDAYYIAPNGKRMKGPGEIAAYLESNPHIKNVSVSDFHFATPKINKDTIPNQIAVKSENLAK